MILSGPNYPNADNSICARRVMLCNSARENLAVDETRPDEGGSFYFYFRAHFLDTKKFLNV